MKKLIIAAAIVGLLVYEIVKTINEMDDDVTAEYRPYAPQP